MAPLKPVKKGPADKRVQSVLDFATATLHVLKERTSLSTNTVNELEAFITQPFPLNNAVALAHKTSEYDAQGSALWNSATKIVRDFPQDEDNDALTRRSDLFRVGSLLRCFAFFMLDAAHNPSSHRTKDLEQRTRNFKIALKASRSCLDNDELDFAIKILETCSKYVATWEDASPIMRIHDTEVEGEQAVISRILTEYFLLRMLHASRVGRHDMANHFFLKADVKSKRQSSLSETAAELCYEIGHSQIEQGNRDLALLWLDRAHGLLDSNDSVSTPPESEDLRLAIVSSLVEILVSSSEVEAINRACTVLTELENDHGLGNRMAVLVMKFNVAMRSSPGDISTVTAILLRMIRSCVLTDSTYVTIMQCIQKIAKSSCSAALDGLEQMIESRILPDLDAVMDNGQMRVWLEKSVVTHTDLSVMTGTVENTEVIGRNVHLFDLLVHRSSDLLSPKATHAMQALIWKALKNLPGPEAQSWLGILQHPLFASVGASNKARIARKLMLDALNRKDADTARMVFYQLPHPAQNEAMTRYLAYKLAILSNDRELASECLSILSKRTDSDHKYLYACVLDAQQSGNRDIAVASFHALVELQTRGLYLPALLRCTARLLAEELGNSSRALSEVTSEVVRVFETAASDTKVFRQGSEEQWRAEIQWWSKNSFNIALQFCSDMPPEHLIRLLKACGKFLECYPDDGGLMHRDDLIQRKQVCHFLCASAFVVLGRSAVERTQQLQHYLEVQREAKKFFALAERSTYEESNAELYHARTLEMLKFDVESAFKLEQWDSLDAALAMCLQYDSNERWETLADLVMVIYERTSSLTVDPAIASKIPQLLEKIINKTWRKDKDILKLARWLRFTFSIALNNDDGSVSIRLVEQAATMARRGTEMMNEPYPEDELQWLATTAFNRAVDLLVAEEQEAANQWMEAALELARYSADNGSLHAHLTRNREEAERRMKSR